MWATSTCRELTLVRTLNKKKLVKRCLLENIFFLLPMSANRIDDDGDDDDVVAAGDKNLKHFAYIQDVVVVNCQMYDDAGKEECHHDIVVVVAANE
jgi:hypothetical protein